MYLKRFILTIVLGLATLFSLNSCVTSAYAEDVIITGDDISVVVRMGTPYYFEGALLYYLYNGRYYYPHYNNGRWYYYRYSRPLPPPRHGGHFTPNHRPHPSTSIHRNRPMERRPDVMSPQRRNSSPQMRQTTPRMPRQGGQRSQHFGGRR